MHTPEQRQILQQNGAPAGHAWVWLGGSRPVLPALSAAGPLADLRAHPCTEPDATPQQRSRPPPPQQRSPHPPLLHPPPPTTAGFLYDSSIPEPFPTATSPDGNTRLWPYSMDYGLPQVRCGQPASSMQLGLARGTPAACMDVRAGVMWHGSCARLLLTPAPPPPTHPRPQQRCDLGTGASLARSAWLAPRRRCLPAAG